MEKPPGGGTQRRMPAAPIAAAVHGTVLRPDIAVVVLMIALHGLPAND
jgi:hypothetical protein